MGTQSKNYDDYIDLRNDGRIVMYRRPHLKNPKWNVRLKIPNTKGYVIRLQRPQISMMVKGSPKIYFTNWKERSVGVRFYNHHHLTKW